MKGIGKAIISGVIIIAIGIAILLIGLALNGWSIGFKEFEMKRYEAVEENTSLKVDFGAGNLKTVFYDEDKIAIDYPTTKGYSTDISEKNGKLSFKTKVKMFSFGIGKWQIPDAVIYLPKDIVFDLNFDLGAGTVDIESGKYGNIKIDVGAGTFTMGDTVCTDFNADVSAGKLEVSRLDCRKADLDVSAGKIKISSLTCPEIYADVSAGSLEICVAGVKAEYSISTSVSAGSCNLTPQTGTTDKKINADVSAGSINITFTE